MKSLVVDDHALVREGLKQVLRRIDPDMEIVETKSAAEAMEVIDNRAEPDLVLLDLMLPDESGFQVLKKLRHESNSAVVVVLSASTGVDDMQRALESGAAGYIPKSSSAGVTLGALRLVLSGGVYIPPELVEARGAAAQGASRDAPFVAANELGLSDRQIQVLALLVRGLTNKAIARQLGLAEQTVKTHMSAALRALNVSNRTQAAIAVAQLGLDLHKDFGQAERQKVPSG